MKRFKQATSNEEYVRLCAESQMRMKAYSSQTLTVITLTVTIWTLAFTVYNLINNPDLALEARFLLRLLFLFVCGIPSIILIPISFSVKENFIKIGLIGAYVKIFYELPSIEKFSQDENIRVSAWEMVNGKVSTTQKSDKKSKMWTNTVSSAYIVLAIFSMVFIAFSGIGFFVQSINESKLVYSIFILVLGIAMLVISIIALICTCRETSMYASLGKIFNKTNDIVLNQAVELGLIDEDAKKYYLELLKAKVD